MNVIYPQKIKISEDAADVIEKRISSKYSGFGDNIMLSFFLAALETDAERRRFTEIYEKYHVRLENAAIHILTEQKDAEDAVQNAFMQVIQHFEKISEISCEELPFWLISIVKNKAFMILRKKRKVIPLEDWDGIVNTVSDMTEYAEVVELFAQLPDTYKAVLEMKYLLGCSGKEISKHLGISETAVSTRASRGRALLRKIAEKEGLHP